MPTSVLTELERRVIGHLSIPRNLQDLAGVLFNDQHAPVGPGQDEEDLENGLALATEADLHAFLPTLEELDLIVNLGQWDDHTVLAAKVADGYKRTLAMPDEKARNYSERLKVSHRAWRTYGDLYMLTAEGFEQLMRPIGPVRPRMPFERLLKTIHSQALAVVRDGFEGSIHDEDGGRYTGSELLGAGKVLDDGTLVATLLPEQFDEWYEQVVDAHLATVPEHLRERVAKDLDRARRPIAGGAGYGNATEDKIQIADIGGPAYSETSPTYVALTVGLPVTDVDTGSTISEATGYTGYGRISVANTVFAVSSGGSRSNSSAIVGSPCTAGSATVTGMARLDLATVGAGRIIRYATTGTTVVSPTQTPPQFQSGALVDTLD